MLTNAAVKAARPSTRAYKRFDERGLFLYVAPTGTRSFRMRFRLGGKEQLLTIGTYPEITLDQARDRRDAVLAQLGRGEDPRNGAAAPIARTFEVAARAWHGLRHLEWTPVHAGDVLTSLERDVFPAIGALALDAITRPEILGLLRAIERRGAVETARRIQQRICGVFRLAMSEGWCDANPTEVVTEGLAKGRASGRHPALVDAAELRAPRGRRCATRRAGGGAGVAVPGADRCAPGGPARGAVGGDRGSRWHRAAVARAGSAHETGGGEEAR